ncbi:MAG TPA: TetR/AcrR family transcriptional regulator [Actinomycetota bacterium]|nr:TetR/AcrR family transcriptional regulator [Actinomycetota bacterium]
MRKPDQRRLTPDDWAGAALAAIAHGGVDAVAVEVIAGELGATKGSFYWHFKNRDALIEAALALWEERSTGAVIEHLEKEPDPAWRLRTVLEGGFQRGPTERAEIALLANPGHPVAVRAVRRVAERRITYLADQLEALGWRPQEARDRAVLLGYLYVGNMQLAHAAPNITRSDTRQRLVDLVFNTLIEGVKV